MSAYVQQSSSKRQVQGDSVVLQAEREQMLEAGAAESKAHDAEACVGLSERNP